MSSENKGVPKVSVIIPGWNERKNIEKCIQNYQSQTYDNFNLILVLGGEDPYIEKAKHHKWEKLIVLDQIEPNKSKALNIGVKHPEAGDLLVFTDMDCRVPDDYIQRYIEKFEDPQINVMAGRSQPYQEDKTLLADYILGNERRRLKNKPEKGYYITGRNFACRKRFLVEKLSGFDEDVKIST